MKINFRELEVYTSIKKDKTKKVDASFLIADTIYQNFGGLVARSLAYKIYEQGEVDLNDKEVDFLSKAADGFVGVLADSIKDKLSS